jgi:hypothetical protein
LGVGLKPLCLLSVIGVFLLIVIVEHGYRCEKVAKQWRGLVATVKRAEGSDASGMREGLTNLGMGQCC